MWRSVDDLNDTERIFAELNPLADFGLVRTDITAAQFHRGFNAL